MMVLGYFVMFVTGAVFGFAVCALVGRDDR